MARLSRLNLAPEKREVTVVRAEVPTGEVIAYNARTHEVRCTSCAEPVAGHCKVSRRMREQLV
jgi:hypothetical protein